MGVESFTWSTMLAPSFLLCWWLRDQPTKRRMSCYKMTGTSDVATPQYRLALSIPMRILTDPLPLLTSSGFTPNSFDFSPMSVYFSSSLMQGKPTAYMKYAPLLLSVLTFTWYFFVCTSSCSPPLVIVVFTFFPSSSFVQPKRFNLPKHQGLKEHFLYFFPLGALDIYFCH